MSYKALDEKVMEMKDEILESIQRSMKIESIRGEAKPDAPYGEGPKAALDDLLALGESMGFKTGHADNRMGWIEFGDADEMVGVLGHVDVVPAGDGWEYPAFGAEIHDGELWGRGALDDKGPTVGLLYGMKAIRDLGLPIDRRIRLLFGSDEECGSSCAKYYVENGYELPTIGFTPDAQFPAIFCEKGMSMLTLENRFFDQGDIEVEYFGGGEAFNIVTPKCKLIVKGDIKVAEADGITVKKEDGKTIVEAVGVSAHGSTPEKGKNAAIMLLNAVKENEFRGDFQKLMNFLLNEIGTETNGKSLGVHYEDEDTGETTVNLGVIELKDGVCTFTLDVRYPKNADKDVVDDIIANHVASYDFVISEKKNNNLLYVPKDSELVKKLVKVYEEETGDHQEPIAIGGGTYAKEFPNMVAYGPLFPGDDDIIHQPNERVNIDKLMKALQVLTAAMYELAQKN